MNQYRIIIIDESRSEWAKPFVLMDKCVNGIKEARSASPIKFSWSRNAKRFTGYDGDLFVLVERL